MLPLKPLQVVSRRLPLNWVYHLPSVNAKHGNTKEREGERLRDREVHVVPLRGVVTTPVTSPLTTARSCGATNDEGTLTREDLKETFENLRRFQIKLNPEKCLFGVPAGQLLGFLVSERGIECNPVKIKAIERMEVPSRLLDVQKFTGCLASISRFINRLGEKALPLY